MPKKSDSTQGARFTIEMPGETLEAFTNQLGYMAEVPDTASPDPAGAPPGPAPQVPNPQSRKDFVIAHLQAYISGTAQNWANAEAQRIAMERAASRGALPEPKIS